MNAMSPSQVKQASMISHYRGKGPQQNNTSREPVKSNVQALISKTISSKRHPNINVPISRPMPPNHFPIQEAKKENHNYSVQSVKPSRILSPGEALTRRNETIMVK
jgi:hypothetical protein